jgi:NhaP-type Na+/H+ and K+/H+ antiporter
VWVWALDRGRAVSAGFTWGLTVTIALGLFAVATYTELSGALVIFLFGVIVGNAALWDYRRRATSGTSHGGAARALDWVRRSLRLDSTRVPVTEIATMQRQVTYIAATFFFFYIGVLFVYPVPNFALILAVPAVAVAVMVLLRLCLTPILAPYLSPEPRTRRRERVIIAMNVPRGLAGAAIAAIVLALPGVVLPGFSNLVFIVILLTNVVATIAIFVFSQPSDGRPELREAGRGAGEWPSA